MKNPKPDFVIEFHVGEPTADGKCSVCNGELTPIRGKGAVGSTQAFRDGYDQINWKEVGDSIRAAKGQDKKPYLN